MAYEKNLIVSSSTVACMHCHASFFRILITLEEFREMQAHEQSEVVIDYIGKANVEYKGAWNSYVFALSMENPLLLPSVFNVTDFMKRLK